ncbi:hypothetical protein H0E87_012183 [Populus deltoides]|uniref:Uncharacterized protein n=1 Tax=Populus deltoides TaxID=3696 RepID=A0A8T2YIH6_POPDE|nr:hypothetical protein H0E87_012183 [Populus deltoides]
MTYEETRGHEAAMEVESMATLLSEDPGPLGLLPTTWCLIRYEEYHTTSNNERRDVLFISGNWMARAPLPGFPAIGTHALDAMLWHSLIGGGTPGGGSFRGSRASPL